MRILIWLVALGAVAGIAALTAVGGYFTHKLRFEPIFSLAERVETRLRRDLDLPSETEMAVARIETIFVNLRGRVHVMPDRDFINGGALTVWGEDLLILHRSGKVFWIARDEKEGMVLSAIQPPENGLDGYARLYREKYPNQISKIDALRFNDIEYVETPDRRGLLLSYTYVNPDQECYGTRVSWLDLPGDIGSIRDLNNTRDDWKVVFETRPCLAFNPSRELIVGYMAGGRMAFKAPNLVYLGSGEYHLDGIYRPDAGIQDDDSDYGKTIEINLDTETSRIYSRGHRNLQGVTLDAEGRLWTTEHGMRGGDELNLIVDGENYGWPIEDMGTLYNGVPQDSPSGPGRHDTYRAPVYAWVPSMAVSSLALVEGFHETWDGDLLIGSLKGRTLLRARIHDDRLVSLEPIPITQRIRDVMQWGPDRIALWMDLNEVIILEAEPRRDPLAGIVAALEDHGIAPDLAEEAVAVMEGCAECHSYNADVHGAGPSLAGIIGRRVAGTAFANYSDALRGMSGRWDEDRLAQYLQEPEAMVEGTAMTGLGLGDPALAAAVAKGLGEVRVVKRLD